VIPFGSGRAITVGDLLIAAASGCVVLALATPALRARSFRAAVAEAEHAVDELRSAAERRMVAEGSWPAPSEPGTPPPELGGRFLDATVELSGDGWTLQWMRLEVVDSVPVRPPPAELSGGDAPPVEDGPTLQAAVRTIGAVSVHAADDRLLGELLERHGRDRSFVRDSTWTLIVPTRTEGR
jgi:hypothetical protein